MTQDFVMGQLRLALVAALAFCGGKGWLSPTDSSLAMAFITAIGPLFAPWIWSIFVNINTKRAPQHSVVIDPVITTANVDKPTATVQTAGGLVTGKVLSVLVAVLALWFFPGHASAQGPTKATITMTRDKLPAPKTLDPMSTLKTFVASDIQAALDDATANNDQPAVDCWAAMLPAIQNAQNPLPTKLGAFLALQKARDAVRGVDMFKAGIGPLADLKNKCASIVVDTNTFLIRLGVLSGGAAFGF